MAGQGIEMTRLVLVGEIGRFASNILPAPSVDLKQMLPPRQLALAHWFQAT